jgi:molybdopterin-guanine dinucleotide biosynthesis protein A
VPGRTRAELTGLLLLGGASSRFGSPKALARLHGETLAERGWRTLGEACDHRIAIGKITDDLHLPFPVLDDGSDVRAPIVGLISGLRAASTDICVALPVDCPLVTAAMLLELAEGCRDVARFQRGPLPGAFRRRTLATLESGELAIHRIISTLDVAVVEADPARLVNVNTPQELEALEVLQLRSASSPP